MAHRTPGQAVHPQATAGGQAGPSGQAPPRVICYVDPICPWAWRTARWLREVGQMTPLDVQWRLFNLASVNGSDSPTRQLPLRVLEQARDEGGNPAIERLYFALTDVIHEGHAEVQTAEGMEAAIKKALWPAGFTEDLLQRALDNPATLKEVLDEYASARRLYQVYGVPWLVLNDLPFGFQGPVIDHVPSGELARDLWQHVSWLLAQPYLFELKRLR